MAECERCCSVAVRVLDSEHGVIIVYFVQCVCFMYLHVKMSICLYPCSSYTIDPWQTNADPEAGLLVDTLVRYAEAHREEECIAQHLFVQAPSRGDEESRCTCVIDESVYSRNRSFRLLFQSKFGKDRRLDLDPKMEHVFFGGKPHPCVALLRTMASFVPDGTELFQHEIIPKEYSHRQLKASRMSRGGSVLIRKENGTMVTAHCDPLVHHLLRAWDEVRQLNEKDFREPAAATVVQSVVEMDNRYITVTLGNNHYCFCKGSSHFEKSCLPGG